MSENKGRKEAAALKYNAKTDNAPYIVGLGQGEIAERMLAAAKEHGIPVVEDKSLAHVLNKLSVGDEIPEELYKLVAQVLVFVANLDRDYGKRFEINDYSKENIL